MKSHSSMDLAMCRFPNAVPASSARAGSDLLFGNELIVQTHGYDKCRRTIADVHLSAGANVDHRLVNDDWCWWYWRHELGSTVLEGLGK